MARFSSPVLVVASIVAVGLFLLIKNVSGTVTNEPSLPANTLLVTKTDDTNDGVCDADCSLREAVGAANVSAGDDVINFDLSVFGGPQTMILANGSLKPTGSAMVTINGPGANLLTIKTMPISD